MDRRICRRLNNASPALCCAATRKLRAMPQPIDRETKLAAVAVRSTSMACRKAGREVGCEYCFSRRYRGCVFSAQEVIEALFPSPGGSSDGGGPGLSEQMVA